MKRIEILLTVVIAVVLTIIGETVFNAPRSAELQKRKELEVITFCLNNGGTAQFSYTPLADTLSFTGCSVSRMQVHQ